MSLPIYVDSYSGYKANERPRQFQLDEDTFEIESVEDRWFDPNAEYFKVRTANGKRYLLRYDLKHDEWTLQSGFDAAELFSRPSITLISVSPEDVRKAEQHIAARTLPTDKSGTPFRLDIGRCFGPKRSCGIRFERKRTVSELCRGHFREDAY